jgi:hypothetical protein
MCHLPPDASAQEFGDNCGPNSRWVNLGYLDSLPYYQPRRCVLTAEGDTLLRTLVYQGALQGYIEDAESRGYCAVNIWASAPPKVPTCPLCWG